MQRQGLGLSRLILRPSAGAWLRNRTWHTLGNDGPDVSFGSHPRPEPFFVRALSEATQHTLGLRVSDTPGTHTQTATLREPERTQRIAIAHTDIRHQTTADMGLNRVFS